MEIAGVLCPQGTLADRRVGVERHRPPLDFVLASVRSATGRSGVLQQAAATIPQPQASLGCGKDGAAARGTDPLIMFHRAVRQLIAIAKRLFGLDQVFEMEAR